jgi:pyrroline-5-carboxylate reductase
MAIDGPLLLVGCGKMGGALLSGWLERGLSADRVVVIEPYAPAAEAIAAKGVCTAREVGEVESGFQPAVVVIAIKPQQIDATLGDYRRFVAATTVFLSIAAGKTIGSFQSHLGSQAAVVRAMPNTPAAVGRGMSVLCASPQVTAEQKTLCGELLSAVSEVAWIDDEALLDPVTAVSGSGPAYVFFLVEALAQAGVEAGLPEALALRLARVTVTGAGELMHQSDDPAAILRQNVTSPGGTTAAALEVLMAADGLQPLMTRAIAAATVRSRELAS